MNQLDIYFRALIEYRKLTGANIECSAFLSAASEADRPTDRIVAVRNICTIDEDWVNEIEKGLDFIEKAIKEERQFILSQGEVVPIEKVKNFSKESSVKEAVWFSKSTQCSMPQRRSVWKKVVREVSLKIV